MSGLDWFPIFLAAAGNPNIINELKAGKQLGEQTYKARGRAYLRAPSWVCALAVTRTKPIAFPGQRLLPAMSFGELVGIRRGVYTS